MSGRKIARGSTTRRRINELGGRLAKADSLSVFNLGRSTGSDVAREKDAMIAQAFEMERRMAVQRNQKLPRVRSEA
jgi:hypothetical protein